MTVRRSTRRPACIGRRAVGAQNLKPQPEGGTRHHAVHADDAEDGEQQSPVDGGAEQPRQTLIDRQAAGLRHRGVRVAEHELDHDIGQAGAEKAHHQRGDDLVDAVTRLEQGGDQRPRSADETAREQAGRQRDAARRNAGEGGRQGGTAHGGEQELPIAAQIPDARPEGNHQAGRDQKQRRHARQRFLSPAPAQQAALEDEAVVAQGILAETREDQAAHDERQEHRTEHTQQGGADGSGARFGRHPPAAPVIRRRTLSSASHHCRRCPRAVPGTSRRCGR